MTLKPTSPVSITGSLAEQKAKQKGDIEVKIAEAQKNCEDKRGPRIYRLTGWFPHSAQKVGDLYSRKRVNEPIYTPKTWHLLLVEVAAEVSANSMWIVFRKLIWDLLRGFSVSAQKWDESGRSDRIT